MAFSMSPLASTRAARQSLNPAFVRSRNSFTSWAGICTAGCCVLILLSYLDLVKVVLQASNFCRTARPRAFRGGPLEFPTLVLLGAFFVGRHSGFRAFRLRFRSAFDEVAFLLFVLFVGAGVHVLDAFDDGLVFGGLLLRYLRLLIGIPPFGNGIRNLRRKQPDGAQ